MSDIANPAPTAPPVAAPSTQAPPPSVGGLTRPPSLWPESFAPRGGHTSAFGLPPRPAARLEAARTPTVSLLCQPALALRVMLLVQAALQVGGLMAAADARSALLQAPALGVAGLMGALSWLALGCPLARHLTLSLGRRHGEAVVATRLARRMAAWGAASGLAGWGVVAALGVAPATAFAAAAAALVGASLAACLWRWVDLRARLLRPADANARLTELQSRIRPHFLFNALNTALALVQVEPDKAEMVLEDLSALFRAALAHEAQAVTLDDEIDLAQRYLGIERLRFAHRLEVLWDLDPDAAFARVPPLVLQPLVENAVRHGIEPAAGGGTVWVRTRARQGLAEVEIVNTLPEEPGEAGLGLAQANVRERLKLMHDLAATFETYAKDGRYHARLTVPL